MIKGIVREIRNQPEPVREMFLWVLVVIFSSVIGFVWFKSTEKRIVALLNPSQAGQGQTLAEESKDIPSPFASIFSSAAELKAHISDLFRGIPSNNFELTNRVQDESDELPPQKLPLSGNR